MDLLIETVAFTLLGIGIGIFAGLTPGIHINTTIPLLMSLSFIMPNPYYIAVLVVSVSCTEMFLDQIPAIFIGAPDADTALSVLPGHRLLFEGRGYEAIKLTVVGGIGALLFSVVFIFLVANFFSLLYDITRPYIHFLIIGVIAFMILSERELKKMVSAAAILGLTGLLGIIVLNSGLIVGDEALFPILTGLFGLSGLMISLSESSAIPQQGEENDLKISKRTIIKSIVLASLAGIMVGFLPAVGISEAAVMMQYVGGSADSRSFLITTSGINVANDVFSLISLWLVSNPRSGASVAIQKILTQLTASDVIFLIGVILFTGGIAASVTLYLGKKIPKFLARLNYRYLTFSVMIFIVCLAFLLTGVCGLLILFTSASLGILCVRLGIRRSHCMGCLMLPTLLFFLNATPFIISILKI